MLTILLFPPQSLLHDPVGSRQEVAGTKPGQGHTRSWRTKRAPGSGVCSVLLSENQVLALQQLGFLPKQRANKSLLHSLPPIAGIT